MTKFTDSNPANQDEIIWIKMATSGDQTAFTPLIERYQHPIYNLCYRLLNDSVAAEDATQETFLRAFLKLDTYDVTRRFSTWLYAIANHYCLDQLKRARPQCIAWDEAPIQSLACRQDRQQPETSVLQSEAEFEIQTWLRALPAHERTAIILKYWHQLSYQEIAQILDTSASAIKAKLFRARRKMAQIAMRSREGHSSPRLTPSCTVTLT